VKIVSFDPASYKNLGWAVAHCVSCDVQTVYAGTWVSSSDADCAWQAMWPFFKKVDALLKKEKPDIVVLEKTSSFSGGFITGQVSNTIGMIYAAIGKNKINNVQFLYPTHVKKVLTGKGKASKSVIKKEVVQRIYDMTNEQVKFDSEHAYDACANIFCYLVENNGQA
jgi:Holliday junction resolvasome RuvABC endonuclease subunit